MQLTGKETVTPFSIYGQAKPEPEAAVAPMPLIIGDPADRWLILSEEHYNHRCRHKTAAKAEAEAARLALATGKKFYVMKLVAVAVAAKAGA